MKNKLILGFSSCPNDTFMFDALIHRKISCEGLVFEPVIGDIEELNQLALMGEPDVLKISFANYPEVSEDYQLLTSGSALGYKNGPLLISKVKIYPDEVKDVLIAVPGFKTTANFLLTLLYPAAKKKKAFLFSDIEEAVESGETDAGLIIHESRFTYEKKGLKKISDLGEIWEDQYKVPVPLGGIVVKRSLPAGLKGKINRLVKESVSFAFRNPQESKDYVKSNAQELSESVIQQHIDLYVNEFSRDIGEKGKEAIGIFLKKGREKKLFNILNNDIFVQ